MRCDRSAGATAAAPAQLVLSVPSSTTERTRELAQRLTEGSATTYDKIQTLQGWLGANTTYSLDIPPLPIGRDAVDQYLFEDRQGYCEQIASALAIMLRVLGVPTRLAVGYVPERLDPATGQYLVLDKNAHAWVEVWWPDVGWQGFDPTADVPLAPGAGTSTVSERFSLVAPAVITGGTLTLAAVVAVAVIGIARSRRRAGRRPWLEQAVTRLDEAGRLVGHPHRPDLTLLEYGAELDGSPLAPNEPGRVARQLSAAAFAHQPDEQDRRAIDAQLDVIVADARRWRRARRRREDRSLVGTDA
jgi:hypothetical protein